MANKNNYSKQAKNQVSDKTIEEANNIAKGTQKPGQTKEQTKLIAQGIQKGIDQYKKQQKSKARELDKQLKKAKSLVANTSEDSEANEPPQSSKKLSIMLPWCLLLISWAAFTAYLTRMA